MLIIKRFLGVLLILLIVVYFGLSYSLSNRVLTTNSSFQKTLNDIENYWDTSYEEMIALLPPPTDFSVQANDDVIINGKYFTVSDSSSCLYIFAHGWARSWQNMLKYYPIVEECGCDVIMYDHRAHGDSGGKFPTGGIKESEDLISVTEWAAQNKQFEWNQIAWVGSSWGAGAALMAGADDRNPAFIFADSPYQDWHTAIFERAIEDYGSWINGIAPAVMYWVNIRADIDYAQASPIKATKDISEPVFLIHSKADPQTNSQQSVNIAENLNSSSEFHHTDWGNIHVMDVISNKAEVKEMLSSFIMKNNLAAFIPPEIEE
ncbi:alpha/beta hydrolase [Ekhidna sp. To15]|uniref:alpha/beta hydrolase n=1 Tax=Ekhidna sp. To15 TaxID=3395267 RepID=UPI003F523C38